MDGRKAKVLLYKRCQFSTQLPADYLYSPSHYWMARQEEGLWRVGLTKFAARMLGEMVDFSIEMEDGATVLPGETIGWIEGLKAVSDIFCVGEGVFAGGNPELIGDITLVGEDSYCAGWLYEIRGRLDDGWVDAQGYRAILDATIDRIREKKSGE